MNEHLSPEQRALAISVNTICYCTDEPKCKKHKELVSVIREAVEAERERIIQICDKEREEWQHPPWSAHYTNGANGAIGGIIKAIRAAD